MAAPKTVSWSEIDTARQCSLKHQLTYVERWTKDPEVLSPLSKGSAWHLVMQEHYNTLMIRQRDKSITDERATVVACRNNVSRLIEQDIADRSDELADLIEWAYQGYLATYGIDPQWRVLGVEHHAVCRLPTISGKPSGFNLKMKVDLVVADLRSHARNADGPPIWVIDHKFTRNLPKGKDLDFDDQLGLYTWGLRKLGKRIFGQLHNATRSERLVAETKAWRADSYVPGDRQALDDRFLRSRTYRTDAELDVVATEAYLAMRARYDQQRLITKSAVDSPRSTNPDTCNWRCLFTEPCLAGRKVGPISMREYLDAKGFRTDHDRH